MSDNNTILHFSDITELLHHVECRYLNASKVVILGGHYLIDYDAPNNKLIPLIEENIQSKQLKEVAYIEAGSFPVSTFKYSLLLHKSFTEKNIDSKIVLLVNDHKTPYMAVSKAKSVLSDLRVEYYKHNTIPESYINLITENNLLIQDVLLSNSDSETTEKSSEFLYSESYLRKKFDRILKDKVLEVNGFYSKPGVSGKRDIYLRRNIGNDYSLSNNGECGCSGEVMQFIYTMVKKQNYFNLIMYVPYECSVGVNNGIYAILQYFSKSNQRIFISMITNLPCDNYKKYDSNLPIVLKEYSTEQF